MFPPLNKNRSSGLQQRDIQYEQAPSWIPGSSVLYKAGAGQPASAHRLQTPERTMAVQVSRVIIPLMLSLFLGAPSSIWPLVPAAAAFQLPLCQLINQTVSLEKEGCPKCHTVQTTICSGHCITKDPVIKARFSNVYQHVCTYRDWYYKTFELPDCPPDVDPTVTYPMALSCHCGRCALDTSDCTFESLQPDFCMNDIPFYY